MPYTYKYLAYAWRVMFGLFAVVASGAAVGPWLLASVLVGLAAPMVLKRTPRWSRVPVQQRPSNGIAAE